MARRREPLELAPHASGSSCGASEVISSLIAMMPAPRTTINLTSAL